MTKNILDINILNFNFIMILFVLFKWKYTFKRISMVQRKKNEENDWIGDQWTISANHIDAELLMLMLMLMNRFWCWWWFSSLLYRSDHFYHWILLISLRQKKKSLRFNIIDWFQTIHSDFKQNQKNQRQFEVKIFSLNYWLLNEESFQRKIMTELARQRWKMLGEVCLY